MGQSTEELSAEIAGTRESLASDLDALQDRVSPSAIVGRRKAAAMGRVHRVRDNVMGSADWARSAPSDASAIAAGAARDRASAMVDSTASKVEGSPLAAGIVAFGAGMLIAALLPATDPEARASQRLVDAAKDRAQPVIDEAKAMAEDIRPQVMEAADEIKREAQRSADRLQSEGQASVQQVKDQTHNA